MTGEAFEAFLTRIYTDSAARAEFLANPRDAAKKAGLSAEECAALESIDREGLEMAVRSFEHKRRKTQTAAGSHGSGGRWRKLFRRNR